MTRTIWILSIAAAFVIGTITTGTIAFADDDDNEFNAKLRGSEEVPIPVVTATKGKAEFEVNEAMTKMKYELEVKKGVDILGAAGAHIHCAEAGANGPVIIFLAGVIPGGLDGKLKIKGTLTDSNVINPACGATTSDVVASMIAGNTYVNVHSSANPGGEIRGQIAADDDDDDDD